jgi:integrase
VTEQATVPEAEAILERFREELWRSPPEVVRMRVRWARRWLEEAGPPPWPRGKVIAFVRRLEREGYSPGTVRHVYGIVKRVFDAAGVHWEMGKRGAPRVSITDVLRPALSVEEVERMVAAAKKGPPDRAAFLALCTTYGMRRLELCLVAPGDVDYRAGRILVRTVKGGDPRVHLLPDEIAPWLRRHDFSRRYSPGDLSLMWLDLEREAGVERRELQGWHSVRRALDSYLLDTARLPLHVVYSFLRWKTPSALLAAMPYRYLIKSPEEVDREVFAVHPFLPMWR